MKITDQAGAVTLTRQYDAWGNLEGGASTAGYAFTGREWDPEIGLYYYRARYYDPKMGRFISEDPIGFGGGLNLSAYVAGRPTGLVDPMGLWWSKLAPAHDWILDQALSGLAAPDVIGMAKYFNRQFDDTTQSTEESFKHAMSSPHLDASRAEAVANWFVQNQLDKAVALAQAGDSVGALQELVAGAHTLMDSNSPAHMGYQVWDGRKYSLEALMHGLREALPMSWEIDAAAARVRDYYLTFLKRTACQ